MNWNFLLKNGSIFDRICTRVSFKLKKDTEDFKQDCAIAVAKKADEYDKTKGSVQTFMYWICMGVLTEYRRKEFYNKRIIATSTLHSHECVTNIDEENKNKVYAVAVSRNTENEIKRNELFGILDPIEKVITSLLDQGFKQKTIAEFLGTNEMYISRQKSKIAVKISMEKK
tara:strand:+ start:71750 stop:72262 length:513 start_codon:yes stop_codon:yes gene_type:complete